MLSKQIRKMARHMLDMFVSNMIGVLMTTGQQNVPLFLTGKPKTWYTPGTETIISITYIEKQKNVSILG